MPKGDVSVLDLFSGQGKIWKAIKKRTGRKISVVRIDQKKIPGVIIGDNRKLIPRLDLSRYGIIDCDAYGDSSDQIRLIFINPSLRPGTVVHYTYNRIVGAKYSLLAEIGIGKAMVKKCPTLFSKYSYAGFLEFLRKNGIKTIREIQNDHHGKGNRFGRYGYFVVAKKTK